jgi:hypothetical protein
MKMGGGGVDGGLDKSRCAVNLIYDVGGGAS